MYPSRGITAESGKAYVRLTAAGALIDRYLQPRITACEEPPETSSSNLLLLPWVA